jgi:hypothetical protein
MFKLLKKRDDNTVVIDKETEPKAGADEKKEGEPEQKKEEAAS